MLSHESYIKCKVVLPVKQSKDSDLKGFIPSLLPILSTTDNNSKKRQQKKEEEEKLNTHTHTQREVISNTKDPSQKKCLFSNNNKMLHTNPEILHRNSSLWQLGLELIP
jgi:hypothetical protein